jgi:LuxR family transcriptional activator of conjugal transfer of Ti plasmids
MHRIFQKFIDLLAVAESPAEFSMAIAAIAEALDLSSFAYLALPRSPLAKPVLISTYPLGWTSHYLQNNYQEIDPVILEALRSPEPFSWGIGVDARPHSTVQQKLLHEASQYGIRLGFTVPIHDGHGAIAALTFAADQRGATFERCTSAHARVLQLAAMYFHAHVRRTLFNEGVIDGARLSRREFECLVWASRGKSAWEIGRILNLSRNTVAYYLENAKKKLGVRTIAQAVARLAAAIKTKQN